MTNWLPDLSAGSGPLYLRLADQIEAGIGAGTLAAGDKLPPQRNLAFNVGVTIGTVGRAYALLRERGLVSGEVGRGTYVLGNGDGDHAVAPNSGRDLLGGTRSMAEPGKLPLDTTGAPDIGQTVVFQRMIADILREHPAEVAGYTRRAAPAWLEAGRRWLTIGDWSPDAASVVPSTGGHPAILAAIAAVTSPGDRLVFEELTYSHVARSATMIGRRASVVKVDGEGVVPDDFERICAQHHPKLAFLIPTLQNPTLSIMPESRRREIARIARKYNVWLIEDAIYARLVDDQPVPIAALAPERTFHVGSLSKSIAPGIRGGWVSCPPHLATRVQTAYRMLTGGKPFLLAELAARLVLTGEADAIRQDVTAEIEARSALARATFAGCDFEGHPRAPFVWMKLPDPWSSATFKQAAANEDILIDDEDEYKPQRGETIFHRARIAFSVPSARADVESGFATLRALLDHGVAGYDRYG